jgi:hypothetical protein
MEHVVGTQLHKSSIEHQLEDCSTYTLSRAFRRQQRYWTISDRSPLTAVLRDSKASNERSHGYVQRNPTLGALFHMNISSFVETLQPSFPPNRLHCSFRPVKLLAEEIYSCPMTHIGSGYGFIPRQAILKRVMHFICAPFH